MGKGIIGVFLLLFTGYFYAYSQKVEILVHTPTPETVVPAQNLFVSASVDSKHKLTSANQVQVYLDGRLISGLTKVNGSAMSFLYPYKIKNGKHTIKLEVKVKGTRRRVRGSWYFYAGKKDLADTTGDAAARDYQKLKVKGIVSIDSRSEFLSGPGQGLRQEPAQTQTINIDAAASYKNIVIPVKVFATTDNIPGIQSRDYFQVGFNTKWIEISAGDMNPNFDPLVLSGIRMQGIGIKLKSRFSFLQFYYGNMNSAVEGSVQTFVPGEGILPSNLIDSTHYVSPGTYRRTMMAFRADLGGAKDVCRLGFSIFRAKDDVSSIKYGLDPEENLVAGMDITLKLFHKKVIIKSGAAASVYTDDITNGAVAQDTLKNDYHVNIPIDPLSYKDIIILNSSTVPTNLQPFNYLAYYSQLNYTNKYQSLTIEYKDNGSLFHSLGNPFLQNDYAGVTAGERVFLFKKKLSIGVGYQDYTNNQDGANYLTVKTQGYNGNIMVNPGPAWPTVMFNYLEQSRNGASEIEGLPGINDVLTNYVFNVSYNPEFWHLKHKFRFSAIISDRNDLADPYNKFNSTNVMIGLTESILSRVNFNADFGKAVITGISNSSLSDIDIYNFSVDWQIKPEKYFTSLAVSNNRTFLTSLSDESYRLSVILKFGFRFLKGMGINLEGGYQPFVDITNNQNNYNELYAYVRYTCDLNKITGK